MMRTIQSLRELAGDALIALGELVGGHPGHQRPAPWLPALDANPVTRYVTAAKLDARETRSALEDLSDSQLMYIAAKVIRGWKPLLLSTAAAAMTDVDLLVDALRDRAAQFAAAEREAYEEAERLRNLGRKANSPERTVVVERHVLSTDWQEERG